MPALDNKPQTMLYAIIGGFALAAIIGLIILKNWLTDKQTSRGVIYAHGIVAAVALIGLLWYAIKHQEQKLQTSIILFTIGALVGFYLFARDMTGKMSSIWIALIHALLGVAGFVFLLLLVL